MKRWAALVLALFVAACASSKRSDDEPSTVPPPQPLAQSSPSVEARLDELQTSMAELLDRLDVLNARIAKLESGGQAPATVPQQPAPKSDGQPKAELLRAADIAETYRQAVILYGQAKHSEARVTFQRVFDADPNGSLADNALFWVGETYYAAGDYSSAMRYYERVTREYPEQNKAPDAMFKMGMTYEKSGDLAMARRTFEECIRKYPYSTLASSAKLELRRIKY
jgi:tol-pal system protein YbgF